MEYNKKQQDFLKKQVVGREDDSYQQLESTRVAGQLRITPRPASPKTAFASPITPIQLQQQIDKLQSQIKQMQQEINRLQTKIEIKDYLIDQLQRYVEYLEMINSQQSQQLIETQQCLELYQSARALNLKPQQQQQTTVHNEEDNVEEVQSEVYSLTKGVSFSSAQAGNSQNQDSVGNEAEYKQYYQQMMQNKQKQAKEMMTYLQYRYLLSESLDNSLYEKITDKIIKNKKANKNKLLSLLISSDLFKLQNYTTIEQSINRIFQCAFARIEIFYSKVADELFQTDIEEKLLKYSNIRMLIDDIALFYKKQSKNLGREIINQSTILQDVQLRFIFSLSYLLNFSRLLIDKESLKKCGAYESMQEKINEYFWYDFTNQLIDLHQVNLQGNIQIENLNRDQMQLIYQKSVHVIEFFDKNIKDSDLIQLNLNKKDKPRVKKIIRYVFFTDKNKRLKPIGMAGIYNIMFLNYRVYDNLSIDDPIQIYEICLLRLLVHEYAHIDLRYNNFLENSNYNETDYMEGGYRLEKIVFGTDCDTFWKPLKHGAVQMNVLTRLHSVIFNPKNWQSQLQDKLPNTISSLIQLYEKQDYFGRELRNTQFSGMCEELERKKIKLVLDDLLFH